MDLTEKENEKVTGDKKYSKK